MIHRDPETPPKDAVDDAERRRGAARDADIRTDTDSEEAREEIREDIEDVRSETPG